VTELLPLGCMFDGINDQFVYNHYSAGPGADCSADMQCYCHTDTDAPSKAPTDAPSKSPTDSPTDSPTNSPTNNPTKNPTAAPTNAPSPQCVLHPSQGQIANFHDRDEYAHDSSQEKYLDLAECKLLKAMLGFSGDIYEWFDLTHPAGCIKNLNSGDIYWNINFPVTAAGQCDQLSWAVCAEAGTGDCPPSTSYPTNAPTNVPTASIHLDAPLLSGKCDTIHSSEQTCRDFATNLGKVFEEDYVVTELLPLGCMFDGINDQFVYNHYSAGPGADCSADMQCYCHTDTDAPSKAPTGTPTVSPTAAPTDSPTTSPTTSPTSSPTTFPQCVFFPSEGHVANIHDRDEYAHASSHKHYLSLAECKLMAVLLGQSDDIYQLEDLSHPAGCFQNLNSLAIMWNTKLPVTAGGQCDQLSWAKCVEAANGDCPTDAPTNAPTTVPTASIHLDTPLETGRCDTIHPSEQTCRDFASSLLTLFEEDDIANEYYPIGCVFDLVNNRFLYNHFNAGPGAECSTDLKCYCHTDTDAPSAAPTTTLDFCAGFIDTSSATVHAGWDSDYVGYPIENVLSDTTNGWLAHTASHNAGSGIGRGSNKWVGLDLNSLQTIGDIEIMSGTYGTPNGGYRLLDFEIWARPVGAPPPTGVLGSAVGTVYSPAAGDVLLGTYSYDVNGATNTYQSFSLGGDTTATTQSIIVLAITQPTDGPGFKAIRIKNGCATNPTKNPTNAPTNVPTAAIHLGTPLLSGKCDTIHASEQTCRDFATNLGKVFEEDYVVTEFLPIGCVFDAMNDQFVYNHFSAGPGADCSEDIQCYCHTDTDAPSPAPTVTPTMPPSETSSPTVSFCSEEYIPTTNLTVHAGWDSGPVGYPIANVLSNTTNGWLAHTAAHNAGPGIGRGSNKWVGLNFGSSHEIFEVDIMSGFTGIPNGGYRLIDFEIWAVDQLPATAQTGSSYGSKYNPATGDTLLGTFAYDLDGATNTFQTFSVGWETQNIVVLAITQPSDGPGFKAIRVKSRIPCPNPTNVPTASIHLDEALTTGRCATIHASEQTCRDFATNLGQPFVEAYIADEYHPLGCVFDDINDRFLYNHFSAGPGAECSIDLQCYCHTDTDAPTAAPTVYFDNGNPLNLNSKCEFELWDEVSECERPTPTQCRTLLDMCSEFTSTSKGWYGGGDGTSAMCQGITGGWIPSPFDASSEWSQGIPAVPYDPLTDAVYYGGPYSVQFTNGLPCHHSPGNWQAPDINGNIQTWCKDGSNSVDGQWFLSGNPASSGTGKVDGCFAQIYPPTTTTGTGSSTTGHLKVGYQTCTGGCLDIYAHPQGFIQRKVCVSSCTVEPTPTPTASIHLDTPLETGRCDTIHPSEHTCRDFAASLQAPFEEDDIANELYPIGCVFDAINFRFIYNHFSAGPGAECTADMKCYCHTDTDAPTAEPTVAMYENPLTVNPDYSFELWDGSSECVRPTPNECTTLFDMCADVTPSANSVYGYYHGGDRMNPACLAIADGWDPTLGLSSQWTDGYPPTNYDESLYYWKWGQGLHCHHQEQSYNAFDSDGNEQTWCKQPAASDGTYYLSGSPGSSSPGIVDGCVAYIYPSGLADAATTDWGSYTKYVALEFHTCSGNCVDIKTLDSLGRIERKICKIQLPTDAPTLSPTEPYQLQTDGKCGTPHTEEQICRAFADALGIPFSMSYTPHESLPAGCVHDTDNDVFVYNHHEIGEGTCQTNLVCYCNLGSASPTTSPTQQPTAANATLSPTVSPTVVPTDSPSTSPTVSQTPAPTTSPTNVPTVSYMLNQTTQAGVCHQYLDREQDCVDLATNQGLVFRTEFTPSYHIPRGCVYDSINNIIMYNHYSTSETECSIFQQCYCHPDTAAPTISTLTYTPTTSPTTNAPTSSPTRQPTAANETYSPSISPTIVPTTSPTEPPFNETFFELRSGNCLEYHVLRDTCMQLAHSIDVTFTNHFTPSNHLPRGCVHDTVNDLYLYNHYAVNGRDCSDELVCHCALLNTTSPTQTPTESPTISDYAIVTIDVEYCFQDYFEMFEILLDHSLDLSNYLGIDGSKIVVLNEPELLNLTSWEECNFEDDNIFQVYDSGRRRLSMTTQELDNAMFSDDGWYFVPNPQFAPRDHQDPGTCTSGATCLSEPGNCCHEHHTAAGFVTGENQGSGANHVRFDVFGGATGCFQDLCFDTYNNNWMLDYLSAGSGNDYSTNPTDDICSQDCGGKSKLGNLNSLGDCPSYTEADCVTQCSGLNDCYGFNYNPGQAACYHLIYDPSNLNSPCPDFTSANGAYTIFESSYYAQPTTSPTKNPTKNPTNSPTKNPTKNPTNNPTNPTNNPTNSPTSAPTNATYYSITVTTELTFTAEEYEHVSALLPSIVNFTTTQNDTSVMVANQTDLIINSASPSAAPTTWNETCDYLEEIRLENQCRIGYRTKGECVALASNLGLYPNAGLVQSWQETSTEYFSEGCIHFINSAGQRFMKWNAQPAVANAAASNVPSDEICYVDPVYTSENNYSHSGCACLCPSETEKIYDVVKSGSCPLGNAFDNRAKCQEIAAQLSFPFDEAFTPSLFFPRGCVYDLPNKVMVYNHWTTPTKNDCTNDLICYCDVVTTAPTMYPTSNAVPTTGISVVAINPTFAPTSSYFIPYFESKAYNDSGPHFESRSHSDNDDGVHFSNQSIQFDGLVTIPGSTISTFETQIVLGTVSKLLFFKIENGTIVHDPSVPSINVTGFTNLSPTLVDLNSDGFADILLGTHEGSILTYKWNANDTRYDRIRGPFEGVLIGHDIAISCADLDGDGDQDCVVGEENGNINYFENVGSEYVPIFKQRHGEVAVNPFHHIDVGDNSHPAFIDANGDELQDLLVGSKDGKVLLFLNSGTSSVPHFHDSKVLVDPLGEEQFLGYLTKPATVFTTDFFVTAQPNNPDPVIHDSSSYQWIGGISVLSLISLSSGIFMCRNGKKQALVTAEFDPERQSLTRPRFEPVLGSSGRTTGKLNFGSLRRDNRKKYY